MTESSLPLVTRNYLEQLRSALVGVPDAVARDIIDGAREELVALDASEAAVRIEELGDPAFIAAEARDATVSEQQVAGSVPQAAAGVRGDSRGFVVFVSLLIALGGFVVPVIGWIVGIGLMWLSGAWRRWEKFVVTLGPLLVALAVGAGLVVMRSLDASSSIVSPVTLLFGWNAIVVAGLCSTVFGIWALVRAFPRTAPR